MAGTSAWFLAFPGWVFPGWAFPGWKHLAYAYGVLGPLLLTCFAGVYGGADYLTGLHEYRVRFHFDAELAVPLVPAMVVFYNSLHPLYAIAPLIVRRRAELDALAGALVGVTVIAGVVFLAFPAEDAYPTPSDEQLGVWQGMFHFADRANLRYNSCPSLHVVWAIVCVDVYACHAGRIGKSLLWAWGLCVALSAVLLHQHHIMEVATGLGLALCTTRLFYPWLCRLLIRRAGRDVGVGCSRD